MNIKPIHNEDTYEAALAKIEALWDAPEGSKEADLLEVLAILVEQYEKEHFPFDLPDPVEAILFRMEQAGITRHELETKIGGPSRASEILNRTRALSLNQIRNLWSAFGIPPEVLIRKYSLRTA